jgi:hypothetical protein
MIPPTGVLERRAALEEIAPGLPDRRRRATTDPASGLCASC